VILTDPYGVPCCVSDHALIHEEIVRQLLTPDGGYALVHPTCMMRCDAVRRVGGYRGIENTSEDHDLYLRLSEVGEVANLADPLLRYRQHARSTSRRFAYQQRQTKSRILKDAYARRGMSFPEGWDPPVWQPLPMRAQLREWGWSALKAGNKAVARRHAIGALARAPWSVAAWRLTYCAVRGR
jgi:hypothetical protein